jgi:hypothetical protein
MISTNMVATRSKTAQTHLEDFVTEDSRSNPRQKAAASSSKQTSPKANTSCKRKSSSTDTKEVQQSPKRTKTALTKHKSASTDDVNDDVILINRAPVLHLWAASVMLLTHPELSWESCLSAGAAVSVICAVAKGRSIGVVGEKDSEGKRGKKKGEEGKEFDLMHFKLRLKDGLVVMGGKGKDGGEDALKRKFGEAGYVKVKGVFEEVLKSWKGQEEELNKRAFHMYEDFRPDVKRGQKGWGRKGELRLGTVRSVVASKG